MQSSKTSKKTSQSTSQPSAPTNMEPAVTPRAKSSKSKNEPIEPMNTKLHRKAATPSAANETAPAAVAAQAQATPPKTSPNKIDREQIAQLAHSFWAERGYSHGDPEQDWLRAERQLRSASASA